MNQRKLEIQKAFKDCKEMSIIICQVRQGSGTSNTGNVSRKFFSKPDVSSRITGIDIRLITNLRDMLIAINSGYNINVEAIKQHGLETAKLAVELYPWYKMPQSMHRLFIHLPQIVEQCPATIGQSSEEAIETSHKCTNHALNHHSRQNSYENMTIDMGHYRMLKTDPIVTSHYNKRKYSNTKNPKIFPEGVTKLLASTQPTYPVTIGSTSDIESLVECDMESLIECDIESLIECEEI